MEELFHLKKNGTTLKTEIVAGVSTFMTMAYIIALNPNLLTGFAVGTPLWNAVYLATILSAAIGTFCMAFLANKPFVMAPGMGLNSFFAVVVGNIAMITGLSYTASFNAAMCIILIEGLVFILLSLFKIREKIVEAIPLGIRIGVSPAIGIMLLNIGFGSNAGIYDDQGNVYYMMKDFFGALTPSVIRNAMGTAGYNMMVLYVITTFVGIFIMMALAHRKVNGSVLFGMLGASVVYWVGSFMLGSNPFASLAGASFVPPFADMVSTTLFKFDFAGLLQIGWLSVVMITVTFCMIDMFDTIGTLVGTASRAGMLDEKGNMPQMREALLSDAIGTTVGAVTGTSTVTTFVESAAGVEAGGRTGLTALTAGILFLLCMFLAPVAALIPAPATSAALIYVGILMLGSLKNVHFDDPTELLPVCIMLITMPISGSIGHGIGLALIVYTGIKLLTGKAKEVSILTYVLSALFLVKFFLVV